MTSEATRVVDNQQLSRYELYLDDELVGLADYRDDERCRLFPHVEVDPQRQRQGLGNRLVREALDDTHAGGRRIVARCPFVVAFVRAHPEYADPQRG